MALRRIIRCRNGTLAEVHDWGSRVRLPGGKVVEGRPQGTEEQARTARELGYDDPLDMVRWHDPTHAWLCDALGFPTSFSLSHADPEMAAWEEAAVLAVQRFMQRGGGRLP